MPHHGHGGGKKKKKKKKGGKGKPRKKTDDRGGANVSSGDSSPHVRVDVEVAAEVEAEAEAGTAAGLGLSRTAAEVDAEAGTEAGPQRSGTLASPSDVEAAQQGQRQQQASQRTPNRRSYATALVNERQDQVVGEEFLQFLRSFKVEHREGPFYAGELKSMIYQHNRTFCVYYWHFQGRYAKLSTKISYSYVRVESFLRRAIERLITEYNLDEQWQQISHNPPKLRIDGLPPAGSISSLQYFVGQRQNRLVETVQIYDSKIANVANTTMLGRRLFLGFLMHIIREHKKGCSWSGDFSLDDLIVKNSSTFEIAKITSAHASPRTMAEDLKQLANILEKYFCTAEGHVPGYFKTLYTDMKQCIGELRSYNSDKTKRFQRYLVSHIALKSAMSRGHLFLDLYRVHQALGKDEKKDLLSLLTAMVPEQDWTAIAKVTHPMLRKVFEYGIAEGTLDKQESSSGTKKKQSAHNTSDTMKRVQYSIHLADLLVFIRHVTEHGPDHTKDNDKEQKLKSLVEVDLIIAKYIPGAVVELIKALVMNDMLNGMFVDPWNTFSSST